MNNCHQCQAENEAIARFCANCGATLQQAPPQHQAPQTNATNHATDQTPTYPPPPPPPGSYPQSPPPPQNIPSTQQPAPQVQGYPQQTYPSHPPKPPKKKMNGFVLAIIIILPLLIIGLILFFFLSGRNMGLDEISHAQTLTAAYGFAESTLEQEQMNAVLTLSNQVQTTNTPPPENTDTLENSSEEPTIDHEATAKVEQDLLLQAMVTATASFDQTKQAQIAEEEAKRIYIENLIPEDERDRLETAKKLTNVPERIEETYSYKSEPEGILLVNNIKNFMVTVTFNNHETKNPNETWDIGFWYRIQSGGNGFRTFVTVPNYYEAAYLLGRGHDWITVKGWEHPIAAVDKRPQGKNILVIVAIEDEGKLYINGEFISSFHIGSTKTSGGLYIWKDYRSSAYSGDTMIFEDIHVWDLD